MLTSVPSTEDAGVAVTRLTLDDALDELRRRKSWTMHLFGPDKKRPVLIAAVRQWPECADVLLLESEDKATAYRTPRAPGVDPLTPSVVTWVYSAPALWTLRAVLTIAPPDHPDAPSSPIPAPPACRVSPELHKPRTIRPPH
jgi:hypothetical protein